MHIDRQIHIIVFALKGVSLNKTQVNNGKTKYDVPCPTSLADQALSNSAYANLVAKKAATLVGIAKAIQ